VADVVALLKVILAEEDREAALRKSEVVVDRMKAIRLLAAARRVEGGGRRDHDLC